MKKYLKVVCVLHLIFFSSCLENGHLKESDVRATKLLIIDKGDVKAFYDLNDYYLTDKEGPNIMPYSMIMAYKYNNAHAYFDLFNIIIKMNNKGNYGPDLIKNLDLNSRKFALENLIKSAELGDITAKEYLAKYYRDGIYLPKNIGLAEKLEKEIN